MRRTLLALAVLGFTAWAGPALAQSSSTNSGAGGTSTGGSSKSSVHITTSGGSSVGVAQGSVSGGSRATGSNGDGDQQGSAGSGDGVSGQTAGATGGANAAEDGVVNQVDLPALQLGESQTAADRSPDIFTWAIAGAIVIGLVVLYRRLPRATPAA